jgi:Cullin protein neddylation domain
MRTAVRCLSSCAVPPLQLTIEVVEQLRKMFQPDPRMIKKQLESLIDRDYLMRDTVSPAQLPVVPPTAAANRVSCLNLLMLHCSKGVGAHP